MIDGIHIDEHLVLVALGIDVHADNHPLGLYEGTTENTTSCIGLLSDLEARGGRTDRATTSRWDACSPSRPSATTRMARRAL